MIVLIILILVIIGLIIWFILSNKKEKPKEKPLEPEKHIQEPETPKEPIDEKPQEPKVIIKPDEPEPEPKTTEPTSDLFKKVLINFEDILGEIGCGPTYEYLRILFEEAHSQYFEEKSTLGIPLLIKEENFPNVYNFYGENGNTEAGFLHFVGWLFAMALSEVVPVCRLQLFKVGYELGGYNRYSNIYGYKFEYDPNVLRIAASALYAAVRGSYKWDMNEIREELEGTTYKESLEEIKESNSSLLRDTDFYIDFRSFMPTAPGPYAPNYEERPDFSYPTEPHNLLNNLTVDEDIHNFIVKNYNLSNPIYRNRVVQAIADKEAHENHLFGLEKNVEDYHFKPVFGIDVIGEYISPDSLIASLCNKCKYICSYSRDILQSRDTSPKEYGRLRPGCSWKQEATVHSTTDSRWNALVNFDIEDNDGCPTGYYNKHNEWIYPDEISSEEEFVEYFQKRLWANSYPSGHSAAIMGVALILIEIYPHKADLILRAANNFAISRTIARYHWTSDTINGRIIGAATNAVCHAIKEYIETLEYIKNEK